METSKGKWQRSESGKMPSSWKRPMKHTIGGVFYSVNRWVLESQSNMIKPMFAQDECHMKENRDSRGRGSLYMMMVVFLF